MFAYSQYCEAKCNEYSAKQLEKELKSKYSE